MRPGGYAGGDETEVRRGRKDAVGRVCRFEALSAHYSQALRRQHALFCSTADIFAGEQACRVLTIIVVVLHVPKDKPA